MIVGHSRTGEPLLAERLGAVGQVGALVFGAIHGDEPESATLCRRLIDRLRIAPPALAVIVLPVANPDGLRRGSKDNAGNVDLNRNFPARSWSAEHPPGYHPGAHPLSEPEAAALATLIETLSPRVIVAIHQPLRCVNWDGPAGELAERMSVACSYPPRPSIGYPTPGSLGACYGIDRGLAVITLELPRIVTEDDYSGCLRALDCATIPK